MPDDITVSIIGIVVGFVTGILTTWITIRSQKKRRDVEYYCSSMPLLQFKPTSEPVLTVAVNKSVLTGKDEDKDKIENIKDAFGFSIRLKNVGNETVEAVSLNVELDKEAKILDVRTKPDQSSGYNIVIEKDQKQLNRLKVNLPHINVSQKIHVALVTTGNKDTDHCKVTSESKDVHIYEASLLRAYGPIVLGFIILLLIAGFFENYVGWIPGSILTKLGASLENKTTTEWVWPLWHKIIYGVIMFLVGVFLFYKGQSRFDSETHKPWSSS